MVLCPRSGWGWGEEVPRSWGISMKEGCCHTQYPDVALRHGFSTLTIKLGHGHSREEKPSGGGRSSPETHTANRKGRRLF